MKFCFSQNTFFLILTKELEAYAHLPRWELVIYKAVNYRPGS